MFLYSFGIINNKVILFSGFRLFTLLYSLLTKLTVRRTPKDQRTIVIYLNLPDELNFLVKFLKITPISMINTNAMSHFFMKRN